MVLGNQWSHALMQTLSSIQFLRFVAAFAVCIHHAHTAVALHGMLDQSPQFLIQLTNVGASGVHIFFVISGFIMVYTVYGNKSLDTPIKFIVKRGLRIFPIYWLVCGLYLIAANFEYTQSNVGIEDLLPALLLLPGSSSLIIGPGWTLSFELYFYICFAVVMAAGRFKALVLLSVFFASSTILGMALKPTNAALKLATSHLLMEFVIGGAIGLLCLSCHNLSKGMTQALVFAAVAGFAASVLADETVPSALTWGIPSALLVVGLSMREKLGPLPAWITKSAWLGNSSYLLYLIHTLVFDVIMKLAIFSGASPHHGWIWVTLIVGLSTVIAILMHNCIERPLGAILKPLVPKGRSGGEGSLAPVNDLTCRGVRGKPNP